MVEVVLSEGQLACLKAAVTVGSEESAVLGRGVRIGGQLFSSTVAERFCSDAAPGFRGAIQQEKQ